MLYVEIELSRRICQPYNLLIVENMSKANRWRRKFNSWRSQFTDISIYL